MPTQAAAAFNLKPDIRTPRLQDRFPLTSFRGVGIREDLEVIDVANLLAGVDIDQHGHVRSHLAKHWNEKTAPAYRDALGPLTSGGPWGLDRTLT